MHPLFVEMSTAHVQSGVRATEHVWFPLVSVGRTVDECLPWEHLPFLVFRNGIQVNYVQVLNLDGGFMGVGRHAPFWQ